MGKQQVLITGGCGFVGRHLTAALLAEKRNEIWIVDDLSIGRHPSTWENPSLTADGSDDGVEHFRTVDGQSIHFISSDFAVLAYAELGRAPALRFPKLPKFDEVYHLASVVGGRLIIDGDPLAVGIDLSIDAAFFLWAAKVNRPERILYASSSAAYPISLQRDEGAMALRENMIDFGDTLGKPDFTYGWSKLTGEYLGRIAAKQYGLNVGVVRPFSGYGEDQDPSYPVPAIALRVAARQKPVRVWGSGLQGRDFVHIDDCCQACIRTARTVSDGSAVNIGSGVLTSFRDLARLMIDIEGYDADVQGKDDRPVGVAQRFCDPSYMEQTLGWKPEISLRDGMSRVVQMAHYRLEKGYKPEL